MKYILLTGATGLLGRYLLQYLLPREVPLAVLIRGNRAASARQRLETILGDLEERCGYALPRPVLLAGDLSSPHLGLTREELAWAKRNVRGVLHNAASLSFEDGAPDEEPWKTNLTGTANLLEMTRELGIREFHQVSTAYVCGRRRGRILETDLACGQEFGNDYENSKYQAELLVNNAHWLGQRTIYRPAIIVGDSQTGFSNTFHGFYTPLRIVHMLLSAVAIGPIQADALYHILGLHGEERKNLVPVDWVAAAIGALFNNSRHHGEVYHITPDQSTSVAMLCDVMETAVKEHMQAGAIAGASEAPAVSGALTLTDFLASFREKMKVYQAYWRDDPEFDASQRQRHLPHLPSPLLDRAKLLNLCRFALKANFWWSKGNRVTPALNASASWASLAQQAVLTDCHTHEEIVQLRILGPGGDDVTLRLNDGRPVAREAGLLSDEHLTLTLSTATLQAISEGRTTWSQALGAGQIIAENCLHQVATLVHLLENVFAPQRIQAAERVLV